MTAISDLLVSSIKKTDIDLRKTLFKEIVLAGGNTLMNGFPERFVYEVRKIAPKDISVKFILLIYFNLFIYFLICKKR